MDPDHFINCLRVYDGTDPIQIDGLHLRPGLSDRLCNTFRAAGGAENELEAVHKKILLDVKNKTTP